MALHKATQELLQKQNVQTQPQQPEISTNPPESVEDSAANVDTVSSSEINEIEVVDQPNTGDNAIVVIDDDVKADKAESEAKVSQSQSINEEEAEKLQKALQLLQPPQTILEGLISWLHDQAPLNTEQLSNLFITMDDFAAALKLVQPSAKREGFATVPDVNWDDVGSLRDIREELQMAILVIILICFFKRQMKERLFCRHL